MGLCVSFISNSISHLARMTFLFGTVQLNDQCASGMPTVSSTYISAFQRNPVDSTGRAPPAAIPTDFPLLISSDLPIAFPTVVPTFAPPDLPALCGTEIPDVVVARTPMCSIAKGVLTSIANEPSDAFASQEVMSLSQCALPPAMKSGFFHAPVSPCHQTSS